MGAGDDVGHNSSVIIGTLDPQKNQTMDVHQSKFHQEQLHEEDG